MLVYVITFIIMSMLKNNRNKDSQSFVRLATMDDSKQISDIRIASRKEWYTWLIDQNHLNALETTQARLEKLKETIGFGDSLYLVYEENWAILWFLHWGKSRDSTDCKNEIYAFYVDPNNQKKGIWTKLFTSFFDKCGNGNVYLWTIPGSKWESFYKKMGGVLDWEKDQEIGWKIYKEVRYSWKQ